MSAQQPERAPRYAPPPEQQLGFYKRRCAELMLAVQEAELTMEYQANLIQGLLTAQMEPVPDEPEPVPSGAAEGSSES